MKDGSGVMEVARSVSRESEEVKTVVDLSAISTEELAMKIADLIEADGSFLPKSPERAELRPVRRILWVQVCRNLKLGTPLPRLALFEEEQNKFPETDLYFRDHELVVEYRRRTESQSPQCPKEEARGVLLEDVD